MTLVFLSTRMDILIPLHKERRTEALSVNRFCSHALFLGPSAKPRPGVGLRLFFSDNQPHQPFVTDRPGHPDLIGMGLGRTTISCQQAGKFRKLRFVFAIEPNAAYRLRSP